MLSTISNLVKSKIFKAIKKKIIEGNGKRYDNVKGLNREI